MRRIIKTLALISISIVALSTGVFAEDSIRLTSGTPVSGNSFSWDGKTLILDSYSGKAFDIRSDASIILKGNNKVTAGERNMAAIYTLGTLILDGEGEGALTVEAEQAIGIEAYNSLTIKDMEIDILSKGEDAAVGISVGRLADKEVRSLVIKNVTGSITASCVGNDKQAVYSHIPITLENTFSDKKIGTLIETDDYGYHEYAFVTGDKVSYSNEKDFDSDIADTIVLSADKEVRVKRKDILVKGEKTDLKGLFPSYTDGCRFALKDKKMKKTAVIKSRTFLKGKKKGSVTVQILNAEGTLLEEKMFTVIGKPKLKFPKKIAYEEGKVIDAYSFFKTKDTLLTSADTWKSSNEDIAKVDPDNGKISLLKKGKVKITALYGNVKVSSRLKIK